MKIPLSDSVLSVQDQFGSQDLAQRMLDLVFHKELTEPDQALIQRAMFFFMATTDSTGQPQCSYKGGPQGFVKVASPTELAFPLFEGNGIYLSAGNIKEMGKVGLLFVDFENQARLRVNGVAKIDDNDPMLSEIAAAQQIIRVSITDIHPNCQRNVHKMKMEEVSIYSPKSASEPVGRAPWGDAFDDVLPDFMKNDSTE